MEARQISVQLRRDPREIAERHSQANPLTLSCTLARSEEVEQNLSLYAELHASRTPASVPLAAVGPVSMTTGGTGPWELDFTSAQMNQTVLPGEDVEFWLVVYATSATPEVFTLATIRLTLQYDNISQVIPPPPEPSIAGNVFGPASATDNALVRFDGTTGKLIQNSAATLTDAGLLTVPDASVTGTLTASHIHGNLAGAVYSHVRNESGGPLTKGTPVYVVGYSVGQSRPLIAAAASGNPASMPAIGILDANLANNASGHCVVFGTIEDLDTSAYSVNAPLYVASAGGLTATEPSARIQPIAQVERVNANNGSIIVMTALYSTLAQQSASAVSITGGTITGLTNLTSTIGTFSTSLSVTSSTASTSTTTGALVVTGGVGIGGALNVGADSFFNGVRVGRGGGAIASNMAIGSGALNANTTGDNNTAIGLNALALCTTSSNNIAIGSGALDAITTNTQPSIAVGVNSLGALTTGLYNTAVGFESGRSITTQLRNSLFGYNAGRGITGSGNTIMGQGASQSSSAGASNCIIGSDSCFNFTSGSNNVVIGESAAYFESDGSNLTSANQSIFIGRGTRANDSGQSNQIVIGDSAIGDGSGTTVIGNTTTTQSRLYGGDAFNTGTNGQSNVFGQATVLLSAFTGATRTATALIPANCIVIGVSCRVTTAITGATSFDIGDGTTANLFASAVPVALGSTSNLVIAPKVYAAATNVVCTANGGNFTAGAVRLTVHYMRIVAPTS